MSGGPDTWVTREAPEGFRAAWVVDTQWRSISPGTTCRFMSGRPLRKCGRPAVAMFERGKQGWCGYCDQHIYGRRFWNNAVWIERLIKKEDSPA